MARTGRSTQTNLESISTIRIIAEADKAIPVVDLHRCLPQSGDADKARNLDSHILGETRRIKRNDISDFLGEIGESERNLVSAIDLIDFSADSFDSDVVIGVNLRDLPGYSRRDRRGEGTGIEDKEFDAAVIE